jgi:hypothetical protein
VPTVPHLRTMGAIVKFAISYSTASLGVDPDHLVAYARHAEACGFEALYMPEHVALYRGARGLPPDLGHLILGS